VLVREGDKAPAGDAAGADAGFVAFVGQQRATEISGRPAAEKFRVRRQTVPLPRGRTEHSKPGSVSACLASIKRHGGAIILSSKRRNAAKNRSSSPTRLRMMTPLPHQETIVAPLDPIPNLNRASLGAGLLACISVNTASTSARARVANSSV
jgi:hypothetical protein